MARRRLRVSVVRAMLLALGVLIVIVPYLWIVLTAFKYPLDASAVPPAIVSPVTFSNFQALAAGQFAGSIVNSLIIAVASTVFTLLLGVPAGYAFARGRFRGKLFLGGWLLFSRMIPPVIFIIPLFLFFSNLGISNSYGGVVLVYLTGLLPFAIWMTASYFRDVPEELEDAARVDGCTRAQTFLRISLPLALPGVLVVGLLVAMGAWSEYFIPLILSAPDQMPATVGLVNFISSNVISWGELAAGALVLVVPVFVMTLAAQRGLIRGLTVGAIKG